MTANDGTGKLAAGSLSNSASMGVREFVGTLLRPRWALARTGLGLPLLLDALRSAPYLPFPIYRVPDFPARIAQLGDGLDQSWRE